MRKIQNNAQLELDLDDMLESLWIKLTGDFIVNNNWTGLPIKPGFCLPNALVKLHRKYVDRIGGTMNDNLNALTVKIFKEEINPLLSQHQQTASQN